MTSPIQTTVPQSLRLSGEQHLRHVADSADSAANDIRDLEGPGYAEIYEQIRDLESTAERILATLRTLPQPTGIFEP